MIKLIQMRFVACVTSISLLLSGTMGIAGAEMIGTQTAILGQERTLQITEINSFLAQDSVRKQLMAFGVTASDAELRVSMLTDTELHKLHRQFENMPVGAGLIEIIGIVFVVLLILELLGVTNVFTSV